MYFPEYTYHIEPSNEVIVSICLAPCPSICSIKVRIEISLININYFMQLF